MSIDFENCGLQCIDQGFPYSCASKSMVQKCKKKKGVHVSQKQLNKFWRTKMRPFSLLFFVVAVVVVVVVVVAVVKMVAVFLDALQSSLMFIIYH